MTDPDHYQIKGTRVIHRPAMDIQSNAKLFCEAFSLTKRTRRYDRAFELLAFFGITLNVMNDDEWQKATYNLTIGHCDPSELTISVPNKIYELACKGEKTALSVMFHELGHLLLMHKPLLHFSLTNPVMEEDSEWQADIFSEYVLRELGYNVEQLSFDFYM